LTKLLVETGRSKVSRNFYHLFHFTTLFSALTQICYRFIVPRLRLNTFIVPDKLDICTQPNRYSVSISTDCTLFNKRNTITHEYQNLLGSPPHRNHATRFPKFFRILIRTSCILLIMSLLRTRIEFGNSIW
jgi:hypothetical protein